MPESRQHFFKLEPYTNSRMNMKWSGNGICELEKKELCKTESA